MLNTKELLQTLHDKVAKGLLDKIQSGEATAADYNAAIKFLKDNGIEAIPEHNPALAGLARNIPTFSGDEDNVVPMRADR